MIIEQPYCLCLLNKDRQAKIILGPESLLLSMVSFGTDFGEIERIYGPTQNMPGIAYIEELIAQQWKTIRIKISIL